MWDYLTINNNRYSGSSGPEGVETTALAWRSDASYTLSDFKVCASVAGAMPPYPPGAAPSPGTVPPPPSPSPPPGIYIDSTTTVHPIVIFYGLLFGIGGPIAAIAAFFSRKRYIARQRAREENLRVAGPMQPLGQTNVGGRQMLRIKVPDGINAGGNFQIRTPDGGVQNVRCPMPFPPQGIFDHPWAPVQQAAQPNIVVQVPAQMPVGFGHAGVQMQQPVAMPVAMPIAQPIAQPMPPVSMGTYVTVAGTPMEGPQPSEPPMGMPVYDAPSSSAPPAYPAYPSSSSDEKNPPPGYSSGYSGYYDIAPKL